MSGRISLCLAYVSTLINKIILKCKGSHSMQTASKTGCFLSIPSFSLFRFLASSSSSSSSANRRYFILWGGHQQSVVSILGLADGYMYFQKWYTITISLYEYNICIYKYRSIIVNLKFNGSCWWIRQYIALIDHAYIYIYLYLNIHIHNTYQNYIHPLLGAIKCNQAHL